MLDPTSIERLRALRSELVTKRCEATGKRCFETENEAQRFLYSPEIDASRLKVPTRVYRCPHCHDWHLTGRVQSKPPR